MGFLHKDGIRLLLSTEEVFERIRIEAKRRSGHIRRVRFSAFNGGTTLGQLLGAVKPYLGRDFEFEGLVWDHRCTRLPAGEAREVKTIARELARLDRFLAAHNAYDHSLGYEEFSELCCEYLMLGSRVLNRPARHAHHIEEISSTVSLVMQEIVQRLSGSIIIRKSPYYVPGRIIVIDDVMFFSFYLHSGLTATALECRGETGLFERINRHFEDTWALATGPAMPALGRLAQTEMQQWLKLAKPAEPQGARIFLSYRRDDGAWATGRLFDALIGDYSRDGVFMDLSIGGGDRFPDVLRRRISDCELMFVMIGPAWLELLKKRNSPNGDWVCSEIAQALAEGKHVVPIRIDGTKMPEPGDLPDAIGPLALLNALELHCNNFEHDVAKISARSHELAPPPNS